MALHFLLEDPAALHADEVVLTGSEAHHAATVRRVRVGEAVTVGDGAGAWHAGACIEVSPKRVVVRIDSRMSIPAATPRLVLVQALAKGDRDERAIQAATELGVDEVVPWQAARSVSRWDATKAAKGVARWQSIVREAAKQAHRAWLPAVTPPVSTAQLAERAETSTMLLLEPRANVQLSQVELPAAGDVVLVVGPEGGFAPEELAQLGAAGAREVRLGVTVLRTSTAGPAALAVAAVALGRW